jgi:glycerol-3-phosphate dehydrogenase
MAAKRRGILQRHRGKATVLRAMAEKTADAVCCVFFRRRAVQNVQAVCFVAGLLSRGVQ